jgi:hypothetical protein
MELNTKQKQFLLDKGYVTTGTLDALPEEDWEKYFIEDFDWYLSLTKNRYRMYDLELLGKGSNFDEIDQMINFQGKDLDTLLKLK